MGRVCFVSRITCTLTVAGVSQMAKGLITTLLDVDLTVEELGNQQKYLKGDQASKLSFGTGCKAGPT